MENTQKCSFKVSDFDRGELSAFAETLAAFGIVFNYEISASGKTAKAVAAFPDKHEAQRARTRNAGRRSAGIRPPHGSIFNADTTCAEFLSWQEEHSAAEGMEQLGLSRTTYFRRLAKMRELVEWERVNNPRRVGRGMGELHHTLGGVS